MCPLSLALKIFQILLVVPVSFLLDPFLTFLSLVLMVLAFVFSFGTILPDRASPIKGKS